MSFESVLCLRIRSITLEFRKCCLDEYMFHTVFFSFETLQLKKYVRLISLISIAFITSSFHAMHGYLYNRALSCDRLVNQ